MNPAEAPRPARSEAETAGRGTGPGPGPPQGGRGLTRAAPGAERGGNGGQGHGSRAGTAQGEIGFESVGAAFLVVDRAGWVLRSNGWEEVLQAPTPARIPAADEEPNALIEGVTATIDDARRLAGPARRIVSLELERQRFYTVSAGPIGGKGEGATAALVLEITELFSLGPREGDAIRQLAHDLRTPLTSMSGAVELLESGRLGHLTPEQVRLLEMLGKGMQVMLSLLDDASARAKTAQQTDARGRATA